MAVRFRPSEPDDRPAALGPADGDLIVACRYCRLEWRMPDDRDRAEHSLRRHMTRKHPRKPQPRKLTAADIRYTPKLEVRYMKVKGTTKRSRENAPRLTDGRAHPVTVRRIDDKPGRA